MRWFVTILLFAAILITRSNTGLLTLFVMGIALFISKFRKKSLQHLPGIIFLSMIISYFILKDRFLGDSGRFRIWKMMMNFWRQGVNHWVGAGPGTFWIYGPSVQLAEHQDPNNIFPWMHNDWLQCLFEGGILLEISILFLFFTMLYKSFNRPILFSMVVGFGFMACTQYPLHLFFFQLMGVGLIYHCFVKTESDVVIVPEISFETDNKFKKEK